MSIKEFVELIDFDDDDGREPISALERELIERLVLQEINEGYELTGSESSDEPDTDFYTWTPFIHERRESGSTDCTRDITATESQIELDLTNLRDIETSVRSGMGSKCRPMSIFSHNHEAVRLDRQFSSKSRIESSPTVASWRFTAETALRTSVDTQLTGEYGLFASSSVTCISMRSGSGRIYAGTSIGDIVFFDTAAGSSSKELLHRLQYPVNIQHQQYEHTAVSALNTDDNGTFLVSGHENGNILLWDISEKRLLKLIDDVHVAAVLRIGFLATAVHFNSAAQLPSNSHIPVNAYFAKILSADASGHLDYVKYKRSSSWGTNATATGTISAESDCLLDGTHGNILDMAILSSRLTPGSIRTSNNGDVGWLNLVHSAGIVAISTASKVYIISTEPVGVLQKLPHPNQSVAVVDGPFFTFSSLDWQWICGEDWAGISDSDVRSSITVEGENMQSTRISNGSSSSHSSNGSSSSSSTPSAKLLSIWGNTVQIFSMSPVPLPPETARNGNGVTNNNGAKKSDAKSLKRCLQLSSFASRSLSTQQQPQHGGGESCRTTGGAILYGRWINTAPTAATAAGSAMMIVLLTTANITILNSEEDLSVNAIISLLPSIRASVHELLLSTKKQAMTVTHAQTLPQYMAVAQEEDSLGIINGRGVYFYSRSDSELYCLSPEKADSNCIALRKLREEGKWLEALRFAATLPTTMIPSGGSGDDGGDDGKNSGGELPFKVSHGSSESYRDALCDELLGDYLHHVAIPLSPHLQQFRCGGHSSSHEHLCLVAAVCIEYCFILARLDLLFGPVFETFGALNHLHTFFELLDPFVTSRLLTSLPMHVIEALIIDAETSQDFNLLSRMTVHIEVKEDYFQLLAPLLLKHGAASSFLCVCSHGFDYAAALILLYQQRIFCTTSTSGTMENNNSSCRTLYEVILYVEYCATDRVYPTGLPTAIPIPPQVVVDILEVLLSEKTLSVSVDTLKALHLPVPVQEHHNRHQQKQQQQLLDDDKLLHDKSRAHKPSFPYLTPLLEVDAEATFFVISLAIQKMIALNKELLLITGGSGSGSDTGGMLLGTSPAQRDRLLPKAEAAAAGQPPVVMRRTSDFYSFLEKLHDCITITFAASEDTQRQHVHGLYFEAFRDLLEGCPRPLPVTLLKNYVTYFKSLQQRAPLSFASLDRIAVFAERQQRQHVAVVEILHADHNNRTVTAGAMPTIPSKKKTVQVLLQALAEHFDRLGFYRAALHFWKSSYYAATTAPVVQITDRAVCAINSYLSNVLVEVHGDGTGNHAHAVSADMFAYLHCLWTVLAEQQYRPSSSSSSPSSLQHTHQPTQQRQQQPQPQQQPSGVFLSIISPYLISLAQIDIERTKQLVLSYLQDSIDGIITATESFPYIQYQLLRALDEGAPSTADDRDTTSSTIMSSVSGFTAIHMMTYIRLMSTYAPHDLTVYLSQCEGYYNTEECIDLSRSKQINDAYAYLLAQRGQVKDALELLLRELTLSIRDLVSDICSSDLWSVKHTRNSAHNTGSVDSKTDSNSSSAPLISSVGSLPSFVKLRHTLRCIINTCRTSDYESSAAVSNENSNSNSNSALALWFTALDHLIEEKGAMHRIVVRTPDHLDLAITLVGDQLLELLNEMLRYIPPRMIFLHIATRSSSSSSSTNINKNTTRMRDFRDVIQSMIETENYALTAHQCALRIVQEEHHKVHQEKVKHLRSAQRIDPLITEYQFQEFDVDDFLRQLELTPTAAAAEAVDPRDSHTHTNSNLNSNHNHLAINKSRLSTTGTSRYTYQPPAPPYFPSSRYIPTVKIGGKLSFASLTAQNLRPKLTVTIANDIMELNSRIVDHNDEMIRSPGSLPYAAQFNMEYNGGRRERSSLS